MVLMTYLTCCVKNVLHLLYDPCAINTLASTINIDLNLVAKQKRGLFQKKPEMCIYENICQHFSEYRMLSLVRGIQTEYKLFSF